MTKTIPISFETLGIVAETPIQFINNNEFITMLDSDNGAYAVVLKYTIDTENWIKIDSSQYFNSSEYALSANGTNNFIGLSEAAFNDNGSTQALFLTSIL